MVKNILYKSFTYASKPVANNDTGYINEGSTLSVSNAASAVSEPTVIVVMLKPMILI